MHCRSARRRIPYRSSPSDRSAVPEGIVRKGASSFLVPGFNDDTCGLLRIVGHVEQEEVSSVDLALAGNGAAQPLGHAAPVLLTNENNGEMRHLSRLNQGQRLE